MTDPGIVTQAPTVGRFITRTVSADPSQADLTDRARGVLLGLAVGNLLGLPVEGDRYDWIAADYPDGLTEIDPREANRPMDDDLAQAVDLGEALLAGGDYARDFADRLVVWARENGRGIGITTREVIDQLSTGRPLPEPARIIYERRNRIAPNGGVMRCAPVAIARRNDPERLIADSAITCAVTHYAATCQWSCILVNAVIAALINGEAADLTGLMEAARADGCPDLAAQAISDGIPADALDAIRHGSQPPPDADWLMRDHRLIGHTLLAAQFGLWAAATPLNFEDALVASVAAGGDTDTNAAVAGAVLGARYGASAIPQRWLDCIAQRERIEALADDLTATSGTGGHASIMRL